MRLFRLLSFGVVCAGLVSAAVCSAQTDVGLSLYRAFNGTTTSNGVQVSPSNSAGGLFELRHIANPILGFEGTYSYNRANKTYTSCASGVSGCVPTSTAAVKAAAHEVTLDWVPSVGLATFRPFGVLGVGLLLNVPDSGNSYVETKTSSKAVYVYGAGLDWTVIPHFGLRFQYRGNLYQQPNVTKLYTSSKTFTHTAEPMIGIFFRL